MILFTFGFLEAPQLYNIICLKNYLMMFKREAENQFLVFLLVVKTLMLTFIFCQELFPLS